MHALIWLACAAGCGILWILQELVGSIVAEAIGELLKRVFSPIYTPVSRGLAKALGGAHAVAWRRALTCGGLLVLAGGLLMFFHGASRAAGAECILGLVAAAVSTAGLLSLDSRRNGPPVRLGRGTTGG